MSSCRSTAEQIRLSSAPMFCGCVVGIFSTDSISVAWYHDRRGAFICHYLPVHPGDRDPTHPPSTLGELALLDRMSLPKGQATGRSSFGDNDLNDHRPLRLYPQTAPNLGHTRPHLAFCFGRNDGNLRLAPTIEQRYINYLHPCPPGLDYSTTGFATRLLGVPVSHRLETCPPDQTHRNDPEMGCPKGSQPVSGLPLTKSRPLLSTTTGIGSPIRSLAATWFRDSWPGVDLALSYLWSHPRSAEEEAVDDTALLCCICSTPVHSGAEEDECFPYAHRRITCLIFIRTSGVIPPMRFGYELWCTC